MNKAKAFLSRISSLDMRIQNKEVEKRQWLDIAMGITSRTDGERVKSSGSQQKMANAIDKYIDLEREIDAEIDRLVDMKREIVAMIEQLKPVEYDVLHKRYIQGLSFGEIAFAHKRSDSWATTVHGRALASLNELLESVTKLDAM